MTFHHRLTTRFCDIDRAGIVFFGRYFEYCHAAFEEMVMEMLGPLEDSFASGRWLTPLVHSEADYKRPTRMGEQLVIALRVERLGERSITFAYDIRGTDGSARATARFVHAFVTPAFEPCPIPEEFRAGLQRLGVLPEVTTVV